MDPQQCAVRRRPRHEALNRVGGAGVCDGCLGGGAAAVLRSRGWSFAIKQWEFREDNSYGVKYATDASLGFRAGLGVVFTSRRRVGGWLALSVLAPGVRSGDGLFDGCVYTRSKTARATAVLLADEGVQSILMDMLGHGGSVKLKDGVLAVHSKSETFVPESAFSSQMCVFAEHVLRLCAGE